MGNRKKRIGQYLGMYKLGAIARVLARMRFRVCQLKMEVIAGGKNVHATRAQTKHLGPSLCPRILNQYLRTHALGKTPVCTPLACAFTAGAGVESIIVLGTETLPIAIAVLTGIATLRMFRRRLQYACYLKGSPTSTGDLRTASRSAP
jgi:hypothetical protein